ncbi:hypothetical protein L226DRAFT_70942 [Lentinus tigrinus ALCF2SS1-7]|uniref:uncharacterized protein n=1 Tax=Lentinus tigrinus ALCF2SS1-7 TaxID=1328758 RepID=UPI0011663366|nr:hypothetical protein L226DRAFT_70942 [Lentinus tigrinus ALCF2SS1-7]
MRSTLPPHRVLLRLLSTLRRRLLPACWRLSARKSGGNMWVQRSKLSALSVLSAPIPASRLLNVKPLRCLQLHHMLSLRRSTVADSDVRYSTIYAQGCSFAELYPSFCRAHPPLTGFYPFKSL